MRQVNNEAVIRITSAKHKNPKNKKKNYLTPRALA